MKPYVFGIGVLLEVGRKNGSQRFVKLRNGGMDESDSKSGLYETNRSPRFPVRFSQILRSLNGGHQQHRHPGFGKRRAAQGQFLRSHVLYSPPEPLKRWPVHQRPVRSALAPRYPSIGQTRRLSHPDGSFAGIALIAINLEYVHRLFASLALGPHGSISLIGKDCITFMRQPFDLRAI